MIRFLKYLLSFCLILLTSNWSVAQNCPNSNFSEGNFNHWTGTTGSTPSLGTPYDFPGFVVGQHTIITSASLDLNTGGAISTVPPGATSSCMLGDAVAGWGAESMTYSMLVDMSNRLFVYEYAMVLQDPIDPPHLLNEKPRFIVKMMDDQGQLLPGNCGFYETYGGDPNNNFSYAANDVTYSNWKKVAIDLTAFIGTTVQIQFTTMDCDLGAHWGYAYLSTSCGSLEMDIQKNCEGSIVLTAPAGFDSYLWSPGGETTQSIVIDNPPTGTYSYSCSLNPIAGLSCPSTIDTTFSFIHTPAFSVIDTAICLGETIEISTTNQETGGTYSWSPTGQTTAEISVSPLTNTSYYVTYHALNDCIYTDTAYIEVNALPQFYIEDFFVCAGSEAVLEPTPNSLNYIWANGYLSNTPFTPTTSQYYVVTATDPITGCQQTDSLFIDLKPMPTAAFSSVCGTFPAQFTYLSVNGIINYWNFGDGSPTVAGDDATHLYTISSNSTFLVTLTTESLYGCKDSVQQEFIIPMLYYIPNTFTPDGDEFNNEFKPVFSHQSNVGSYSFKIFNRWGEIVFETLDLNVGWDGMYAYQVAQDGTYTWEMKYIDESCDEGLQKICGHVNLLR